MANSLLIDSGQIFTYVILGVLLVAIVVMFIFSSKRRKKQEEEAKNLIDAVKPGNKVKTIGGICGIVVEVDNEENTFVLETGSEDSGKSYIKFDKQAIYQTDAVVEKKEETKDEKDKPAEDNKEQNDVFNETDGKNEVKEEVKEDVKEEPVTDSDNGQEELKDKIPEKKKKK